MATARYFNQESGTWEILVQGVNGKPGPKGDKGDKGEPGKDGTGGASRWDQIEERPEYGIPSTAYHLVQRDANGRVNFADPVNDTHGATKKYVDKTIEDNKYTFSISDIGPTTYIVNSNEYSGQIVRTSTADGSIRSAIDTPTNGKALVNKNYVDKKIDDLEIEDAHHYSWYSGSSSYPNHVHKSNSQGKLFYLNSNPTNAYELANKTYVDNKTKTVGDSQPPWIGTLSQYNALGTYYTNRLYIIRGA